VTALSPRDGDRVFPRPTEALILLRPCQLSSGVFLRKSKDPAYGIPSALNAVLSNAKNILIADDEMIIALVIQFQLEDLGHAAPTAVTVS
jgi:hypothetical protein